MTSPPVRVLVVDDSAFARKVVREILSAAPGIEVVGIAHDGLDALEKIHELTPDVVTLDLVMPNLDGLGVLHARAGREAPRFVIVSMSDADSDLAILALQAGAVDVVHKPTSLATDRLYEMGAEIVEKVRIAARASVHASGPVSVRKIPSAAPREVRSAAARPRLVVIGTSTGGPQALTKLLSELPGDFPVPIAIALHMPSGYTAALAERLDHGSALHVVEAREDTVFVPGMAAIARAGMHLKIESKSGELRAKLDYLPLEKPHRPSVDVLFESAAQAVGADVLAVVLTGMGEDGLLGARAIRAAGGVVIHEAEVSCVVYGMPRAVHEAGLSAGAVPLDSVVAALLVRVGAT